MSYSDYKALRFVVCYLFDSPHPFLLFSLAVLVKVEFSRCFPSHEPSVCCSLPLKCRLLGGLPSLPHFYPLAHCPMDTFEEGLS